MSHAPPASARSEPTPPSEPTTLVLVPTELELQRLERAGGLEAPDASCELVGFGPIAAAARCAQLLARLRPGRVLLVGIAGSFDLERLPLASAHSFSRVRVDGIGAGSGEGFRSAADLGFAQWPAREDQAAIEGCLPLGAARGAGAGELLTVCAASGSAAEAKQRMERYPAVRAEDMEGFGVALACALQATPLAIVRGISNRVGERDSKGWDVEGALGAARELALELLHDGAWHVQP